MALELFVRDFVERNAHEVRMDAPQHSQVANDDDAPSLPLQLDDDWPARENEQ